MTQKDKELLLKDLCARLPYKPVIQVYYEEIAGSGYFDETVWVVDNDEPFHVNDKCIENIKPYLFPLSSMTEEQEKELSKLGISYGEYALHDDIRGLGIMVDEAYIFFEFCYKNHIDFLGLIEMGLANDATGKGIY